MTRAEKSAQKNAKFAQNLGEGTMLIVAFAYYLDKLVCGVEWRRANAGSPKKPKTASGDNT